MTKVKIAVGGTRAVVSGAESVSLCCVQRQVPNPWGPSRNETRSLPPGNLCTQSCDRRRSGLRGGCPTNPRAPREPVQCGGPSDSAGDLLRNICRRTSPQPTPRRSLPCLKDHKGLLRLGVLRQGPSRCSPNSAGTQRVGHPAPRSPTGTSCRPSREPPSPSPPLWEADRRPTRSKPSPPPT